MRRQRRPNAEASEEPAPHFPSSWVTASENRSQSPNDREREELAPLRTRWPAAHNGNLEVHHERPYGSSSK